MFDSSTFFLTEKTDILKFSNIFFCLFVCLFFLCLFFFFLHINKNDNFETKRNCSEGMRLYQYIGDVFLLMLSICNPSLLYSCFQNFTYVDEDPDMCLLGLGLYSMTGKP